MTVVSGYLAGRAQTKAANKAAEAQREGTAMGIEEQRRQFDIARGDIAPWQAAGTNALYKLQELYGMQPTLADWQVKANADREKAIADAQAQIEAEASAPQGRGSLSLLAAKHGAKGPGSGQSALEAAMAMPVYQAPQGSGMTPEQILQQDPSYQWRFDQGRRGLESSAAARGGLFSGRAAKALTEYGQGAASQEFSNVANRLAGLSGTGQSSAATTGGWGQQFGANAAQGYQNMGNASANAILTGGQAKAGFYNQLGDAARRAATAYFTGGMM